MKAVTRRSSLRPSAQRAGWIAALSFAAVVAAPFPADAKPWWQRGTESNESDFLPPDIAFRVSAQTDGAVLRIRYVIADGYYLYRQKMAVVAESPGLALARPTFPAGTSKTDPYLGTQEIYTQQVDATVAYRRLDAGAHPVQIKLIYQGCAEAGLCYPPISKVLVPSSSTPVAGGRWPAWEGYIIIVGFFAFLSAGAVLRGGRRLDAPA